MDDGPIILQFPTGERRKHTLKPPSTPFKVPFFNEIHVRLHEKPRDFPSDEYELHEGRLRRITGIRFNSMEGKYLAQVAGANRMTLVSLDPDDLLYVADFDVQGLTLPEALARVTQAKRLRDSAA